MPYKREWVPAEVALEYKGVTVYHEYNDDDYEDRCRYWYNMSDDDIDDSGFDIRDLMKTRVDDPIEALKKAIDEGRLKNGVRP